MSIHNNNNCYKYIIGCIIFGICSIFLIQSITVIINFEETQNYINNTCSGISNLSIIHKDIITKRATTLTTSLDSNQNITLYYPPIDVWVLWYTEDGHKWYNQLKSFVSENKSFVCYVKYPYDIGISKHLSNIWFYYILGTVMFIICGGIISYCCIEKTHIRHREYYQLN